MRVPVIPLERAHWRLCSRFQIEKEPSVPCAGPLEAHFLLVAKYYWRVRRFPQSLGPEEKSLIYMKQVLSQPAVAVQHVGLDVPSAAATQHEDFRVVAKNGVIIDAVAVRVRQVNRVQRQGVTYSDRDQDLETYEQRCHPAPSPRLIDKRVAKAKQDIGANPEWQRRDSQRKNQGARTRQGKLRPRCQ